MTPTTALIITVPPEAPPILTEAEVAEITGLEPAGRQVTKLKALGFWLAHLSRAGRAVVPRPHYLAVCAGAKRADVAPAVDEPEAAPRVVLPPPGRRG